MLFNLLAENAENTGSPWATYIMLGAIVVIFIVMMVFSRRSQKKKQDEITNMLNAIKPGNKVKTIGGICGVVVELCKEDNTFVLETGTQASGKSYLKFDMQAIYQTDAKVENATATETPATEEPFEGETVETEQPAEAVETVEEKKENE